MYADGVQAVVRAAGNPDGHRFAGQEAGLVIAACDAGLCNLVPKNNHKNVFVDETHGNLESGLELTAKGERLLATMK